MRNRFPRHVKPELIESGDFIRVDYPEDGGIIMSKSGIVAFVQQHAGMRYFMTQQGSVIGIYTPGEKSVSNFTLLSKTPYETPMLELFSKAGRI